MMNKSIILVDDNTKVLENNKCLLKMCGYAVTGVSTLAEARKAVKKSMPDIIVLDIMLPDGDGLDFLRELRKISAVPVLLLSAKGSSLDIVKGLSFGADDYLLKPYVLNVFIAKIGALLRRTSQLNDDISLGSLHFDLVAMQVFFNDEDLMLTQKEFALLLLLAQNEGKVLSPKYLYNKVWGRDLASATLKVTISNLKKKLIAVTDNILIETSRGEGYYLIFL